MKIKIKRKKNTLNLFQYLISFIIDATSSLFLFQIIAWIISYFYFLSFNPGFFVVWICYYIIGYYFFSSTLGLNFWNAGIIVKGVNWSKGLRILIRESFTTVPAFFAWVCGWSRLNIFRSLLFLLLCLILLIARKWLFRISIVRGEVISNKQSWINKYAVYIYLFLIIGGSLARIINTLTTFPSEIYSQSLLYGAPRPTSHSVIDYIDYLNENRKGINDYIMKLYEDYDHIILSERYHPEMTQYDMIYNLVTDERFVNNIGNVFTEIGNESSRGAYNEFVNTSFPNDSIIEENLSNFLIENQAVHLLWYNTNWFEFLKRMYYFNHGKDKKVNILFADRNWIDKRDELDYRDSIMADNIIETIITDSLKKSLTIMNSRHAFLTPGNCGYYIEQKFPGKVANVLINFGKINSLALLQGKEDIEPYQSEKWDVAFEEIPDSAFAINFKGSPFGKDHFDMFLVWKRENLLMNYEDVFTGLIYYQPVGKQFFSYGYPHILDSINEQKLLQREELLKPYNYNLNSLSFLKNKIIREDTLKMYYNSNRTYNLIYIGLCIISLILLLLMFLQNSKG